MDESAWGKTINWLMGAIMALLGIVWKKQDTRIDKLESAHAQSARDALTSVQAHEVADYAKHDELGKKIDANIAALHQKIDDTRKEIKGDINTVITLLRGTRP